MSAFSKYILTLIALFGCLSPYIKAAEGENNFFSQRVKVATLDWTVAETIKAIGGNLIAVGDIPAYKSWVQYPELTNQIDLGIRLTPNIELIEQLPIDLFINTGFYSSVTPKLLKSAPVTTVNFYEAGEVWQNITKATLRIGDALFIYPQAQRYVQHVESELGLLKASLSGEQENRPIAVIQFIDGKHFRIYGSNSIIGAVLSKLELINAYPNPGNLWGFDNKEITYLTKMPSNTRLVVIKPYPLNVPRDLEFNSLWQQLPFKDNLVILPSIWTFGGLPSALRFGQELVKAFEQGGEQW